MLSRRALHACLACWITTLLVGTPIGYHSASTAAAAEAPRPGADAAMRQLYGDADAACRQGQFDRGIALADEFLVRFPDAPAVPSIHWIKLTCANAKGDRALAEGQARLLIVRYPGTGYDSAGMRHLAEAYIEQGRSEDAAAQLRRALPGSPVVVRGWVYTQLAACHTRFIPPRWELAAATVREATAARQAASPEGKEDWDRAGDTRSWPRLLTEAESSAQKADPIVRTLGFVDLLSLGDHERAYAYLAEPARRVTALARFKEALSRWGPKGVRLDGAQKVVLADPANGLQPTSRNATTTVELRVADDKDGAWRGPHHFEWVREEDVVWRLAGMVDALAQPAEARPGATSPSK